MSQLCLVIGAAPPWENWTSAVYLLHSRCEIALEMHILCFATSACGTCTEVHFKSLFPPPWSAHGASTGVIRPDPIDFNQSY